LGPRSSAWSLVDGEQVNQSLIDDKQIRKRYEAGRDTLPTKNVRSLIGYDERGSAYALRDALGRYLVQIGKGEYAEKQSLLDRERLRSSVIDAVVEQGDCTDRIHCNCLTTSLVTAAALTTVMSVTGRALLKRLG
jgi:hypothetical protein